MKIPRIVMILLVVLLGAGPLVSPLWAQEGGFREKIVMFHDDVPWQEIQAYAEYWEISGVLTIRELPIINGLVLKVPEGISSSDLAADPRVLSVEDNQKLHVQGLRRGTKGKRSGKRKGDSLSGTSFIQPVPRPPGNHRPWGVLKLYDQLRDPELITDEFEFNEVPWVTRKALWELTKHPIKIAVLDTGIDASHPLLRGIVRDGFDFTRMTEGIPQDDNGHGTHIAGTIWVVISSAAFGLSIPAELYSVKILDRYTYGDLYNIVLGLQWAIIRNIDLVNLSVAYRDDSPAVRKAIEKATQAGIVLVAAAGNHSNWDAPRIDAAFVFGAADGGAADGGAADGGAADGGAADGGAADGGAADGGAADGGAADGGAADGGYAGLSRYAVMYPARYPEVIAVGASTPYGELASFSNSDEMLDVTAPGVDILSTAIASKKKKRGAFGICSGTSMAAPHVTATVAMMLAMDPGLSTEEIRGILRATSEPLRNYYSSGDLDMITALETAQESKTGSDRAWLTGEGILRWFSREIHRKEAWKD
ncbi:MAG: S8 family serine peptidase [Deltaproteobacteria bacterium]|nr:S8 family serine peptidase [Deltaproteobacteria bacterium]